MLNGFNFNKNYFSVFIVGFILGGVVTFVSSVFLSLSENSLNWQGIIPGQTSQTEVIDILGSPDHIQDCEVWGEELDNPYQPEIGHFIRPCLFSPLTYEYEQVSAVGKAPGVHQIHIKDGKVSLIIEDTFAYPYEDVISNKEIIGRYGWPRLEAWAREQRVRHLLYCEQRVIFAINHQIALRVFYFEPMPIDRCLRNFEFYLTLNHPGAVRN